MTAYLQADPGVHVAGTALSGPRALEVVARLRPDVVTLDLEMPGMNGLEVLDRLMHECPTPVLLVSGVSRQAAAATLRALDRGAVDFILKYTPGVDTDPEALRREIGAKVRLAARIKVIRSLGGRHGDPPPANSGGRGRGPRPAPPAGAEFALPRIVVIGASTGGPVALREMLGLLPADFPEAVVVVQHMPATFTRVLAAQLDRQTALRVKEAEEGDRLRPGTVLVAPGDYHLLVRGDGRVELVQGPKVAGHRPSIDVTMQSVAQVYGPRARGVVLTGMGSDGARGLASIHRRGGQTFAQDPGSCVVSSMPVNAVECGGVDRVAPPAEIARQLCVRGWAETVAGPAV
jgi:two-component system chemotaxis response regulator CheB